MSKITTAAADRCAKHSLAEQLEDSRRQLRQEAGARCPPQPLRHDNWLPPRAAAHPGGTNA